MRVLKLWMMSATLVVTASLAVQSVRAARINQIPRETVAPPTGRLDQDKKDAAAEVHSMRVMTQQMIDQVFSFGELGYQEFETVEISDGHPRHQVRDGACGRGSS